MSKRIGNYVGFSTFLEQDGGNKGVWNLIEQFYFKGKGEWGRILATGGTIETPGDGYKYHIFTASSTPGFDVSLAGPGEVEYLVVAGGGGGGGRIGGGGGAGGYRTGTTTISIGPYPITIGAGGNGIPITFPNPVAGNKGTNSIFNDITSSGGGAGANANSSTADPTGLMNGGSGGGGTGNVGNPSGGTGNTPPVSPPQGNPGGSDPAPAALGAGGGGAGESGYNNNHPTLSGYGGNGLVSFSGIPPSYGTPGPTPGRWFAGGGAGGAYNPVASGGAGGGGAGGSFPTNQNGSPATINTGGGGGGGGYSFPQAGGFTSGNGGSGIVIIRYLT
jgi:hypothetical protein